MIDEEWEEKKATLKSHNPQVVERSRKAIEDRWTDELAVDTLRNEVFWIGIAVDHMSWAIPMGHLNGEMLLPAEIGDGSTTPPEGYRKILANGNESMAKAKYFVPPVFAPPPSQLTQEQVFEVLGPIFLDETIVKIGHNIKFDCKSIAKYLGGLPKGSYVDTQLLEHIMDENLMKYSLQGIIAHEFDKYDPYHRHGKLGKTINYEPFSLACEYVHLDVRWTWMMYRRLWRKISRVPKLLKATFADQATLPVLAQMEMNGIQVNQRAMKKLGQELELELNQILLDMANEGAPLGFNPDSTVDKRALLFNKKSEGGLGLKPTKKTPGGEPSTDSSVLEKLKGEHPLIGLMLRWQEVKKMKSTYVDGLRPQLNKSRLHPQFHLHRAATGRLSSSNPNLQNIPRDGKVRSLFVAEPSDLLIVADYSQIELRVMCMFSEDPAMSQIFIENQYDLHTATAAAILSKAPEDITPDERQLYGKMPNFLIGYGGTAKLLAEKAGIPLAHAESVIEGYDSTFSQLTAWKKEVAKSAHRLGYSETLGGRRRRLPELQSSNIYDVYRAERQAVNHVVQGTASEICKAAMVKVHKMLPYPSCKMLVQVHDELVISVPAEDAPLWKSELANAMGNGAVIMGIPIEVNADSAGSWYDAK
jgi:DNA polymerase-1